MVGAVGNPCAVRLIFAGRNLLQKHFMMQEAFSKESLVLSSMNQDIIYPPAKRYW
jgi:hypothetical protein